MLVFGFLGNHLFLMVCCFLNLNFFFRKIEELFKCINMILIFYIEKSFALKLHFFLAFFQGIARISIVIKLKIVSHSSVLGCHHWMLGSGIYLMWTLLFAKTYFFLGYRALNMKRSHIPLFLNSAFKIVVFHDFSTWLMKIAWQVAGSVWIIINFWESLQESLFLWLLERIVIHFLNFNSMKIKIFIF